ncbi:MAG: LacI family DNA-binding transcriptional regulator [Spirochaetaceae bacterium]|nr:LacI family DNA-binding transcriptional regulator [Spirochaetaceae bacterium]
MTIQDVADEAGVSIATVSRVLNNHSVRKDSLEKVERAIEKLNFIPNALAQGLMHKMSKTMGTLITSMTNAYYMEITEVIEKRLWEKESMLFLCSTDGDRKQEKKYLESLAARQVDGIIMIDPTIENFNNGLYGRIARRLPLVLIHSFPEISGLNSVTIDQNLGMEKVMKYLFDKNHRNIGFLRGFHGHSFDIKETCWRSFLENRGFPPAPDQLIVISAGNTDNAIIQAKEACIKVLSQPSKHRPSSIFACNDLMALGAIAAAHSLGLDIPGELSVIGHDNTNLTLSSMPQMSTVDLKLSSIGNAAVDLLFHAMNPDDTEPRRIILEPELVIRGSSGEYQ